MKEPQPFSSEFFYVEQGKPRQDADLHEPILAGGDEAKARKVSAAVARRIGLSDAQIASLTRKSDRRKQMQIERAKAQRLLDGGKT